MCRISAVVALLLMSTSLSAGLAQETAEAPVQALRQGGHMILFRHATVDRIEEPALLDLADCGVQRQLIEEGRDQAQRVGRAFQALGIPVGQVLSSEYCRTLETARLAFGRAQSSEALLHPDYLPLPGAPIPPPPEQRLEAARALLATPPPAGMNTALITHGEVVRAVVGFDLEFAEAAIYRPDGRGGTLLVARVPPPSGRWPPGMVQEPRAADGSVAPRRPRRSA